MKKLVLFAVAGVAVIGAVIGLIGSDVVHKKSSGETKKVDPLAYTSKPVASVCHSTDYKEACVNSMGILVNNQTATPKDFIQAAMDYTLKEVQAALDRSGMLAKAVKEPREKMAVEDCQNLMRFAIDELQQSLSSVGKSGLHKIIDKEAELRNWLSAAISYHRTCIDGCADHRELNETMSRDLINATQLTSNALAIASTMPDIFQSLNISVNKTAHSKHLVEKTQGYPWWLSSADRKLLDTNNAGQTPNAVVAQDGSGQYKTIGAALAAYPKNNRGRFIIYVKAGTYNEYVTVTKDKVNVFMYGDGPRKTMVTGNKSNAKGISTMQSATFAAVGTGFVAKDMGFQNTAGPDGHQAVALRSQSDMSAFYNCRIDGYQDTLYAQTHRQFYRNCVISGTVDFIFGDGAVVIQNSLIIVRKPGPGQKNTVTAQGRTDRREPTGIVIQNCRIVPEQKLFPERFKIQTFLGRPWKEFSMTLIMESTLADFIQPAGWMPWQGDFALNTLFYREYVNRGPGATTGQRVKWKGYKVITDKNEVLPYTAGPFLKGDQWLQGTGAPFFLGLKT